uniref:Uncharacterized protein n=1 Tax=uncultured Thiotrichaceae bacterium TaxID=298394 RepID=A0A6S6UJW7_9GAMM|nr:MAG: Unknown protein [uncultured Thiotrichaceae bacterium]
MANSYLIISVDDLNGGSFDEYADLHAYLKETQLKVTYFPTKAGDGRVRPQIIDGMKADTACELGWHGYERGRLDANPVSTIDSEINDNIIAWPFGVIDNRTPTNENRIVARGTRGVPNDLLAENFNISYLNSFSLGYRSLHQNYQGSRTSPASIISNAFDSAGKLVSLHLHNSRGFSVRDLEFVVETAEGAPNVEIRYQSEIMDIYNNLQSAL